MHTKKINAISKIGFQSRVGFNFTPTAKRCVNCIKYVKRENLNKSKSTGNVFLSSSFDHKIF